MTTFIPDMPDWLRWVGFSVGAASFLLGVGAAAYHLWRGRKLHWETPVIAGSGQYIPNPPVYEPVLGRHGHYEMTIADAMKHLAFESEWADKYDPTDAKALVRDNAPGVLTEMKWQRDLAAEFLEKAVDLRSRGKHKLKGDKVDNGLSEIPSEFWQKAQIEVVDLMLTDIGTTAYIPEKESYRSIVFDPDLIEEVWPKRNEEDLEDQRSIFHKLVAEYDEVAEFNASSNERAMGKVI